VLRDKPLYRAQLAGWPTPWTIDPNRSSGPRPERL